MRSETKRGEPGGTKEKKTIGDLGGNLQTTGEVSGLPQTSWSYKNQFFSKISGMFAGRQNFATGLIFQVPEAKKMAETKLFKQEKGKPV